MPGHRGWTAQDDEDLLHLAGSGFKMESIAWVLDRSPATIRARLAELEFGSSWLELEGLADSDEAAHADAGAHAQVGPRRLLGF